ncbi:hypothetical protein A3A76_05475 [Candidatus Woesebacteria bacterium RIFCSPLOWO2_01_FULL_39_23]|nr:MAG: hypothetical protein A2141_03835 [Candidatus Woesebacteria bacterium RBG_16_40_11]OGM38142.1 MAG: hypothetical protein A3E41_00955 [Candidatus Woesebacteria bacterium RIFCSPHIGHO2_12_FULL_38_9]OGM61661.1 MAG: hypothetical protein A3A76_05475 [Candidatus Woesebacteria bacterium RIFCSPLOWO2_01_FULL_39_23]
MKSKIKLTREWGHMYINISHFIAVLIFLSGLLNIASSLFLKLPVRIELVEDLFPLGIIHLSRTLVIIFGIFLVFLARGLWQRKERSWWLSVILIALSIVLHLIKRLDYEESIMLLFILTILVFFKNLFTVKSSKFGLLESIKTSGIILILLFVYSFFGFYILQGQFSNPVTISNISNDYFYSIFGVGTDILVPRTRHAVWFEDSISTSGIISIGLIFAALFVPLIDKKKPSDEQKNLAREMMLQDATNSVSYFGLMADKSYFFNKNKTSFLAYKVAGGVAVVLGDPIGEPKDKLLTLREFIDWIETRGLIYAFYNITATASVSLKKLGLKLLKVGEEAIVYTSDFSIDKPEMKDVRYGVNRIKKLEMKLVWYQLDQIPWSVLQDVDRLYRSWLQAKKAPALSFSLGFYPFPLEPKAYLLVVYSSENQIQTAFSFYSYKKQNGMVLDLMIRGSGTPNGVVEGALANTILHFRDLGLQEVSLGMAPLANVGPKEKLIDKAISYLFNNFNQFYGYKYLFNFKEKFNPSWKHKYLAYKNVADLPKITFSLVRAHFTEKDTRKFLLDT